MKTRKRMVAMLMTLVLAPPVALVSQAAPASAHGRCSTRGLGRVSDLSASKRVSCAQARRVAAAYDSVILGSGAFPGKKPVSAGGFACASRRAGGESEETFKVHCRSKNRAVRFIWGV